MWKQTNKQKKTTPQTVKTQFSQVLTINSDLLFGFILQYSKHCHRDLSPWTVLPYILWVSFYMYMLWLF